jgi:proline dehydrogenase
MNLFNRLIVGVMPIFPKSFIWIFSRRYIAGKLLSDGVEKAKQLNTLGCCATMDVLGEDISSLIEATRAKEECLRVLSTIKENRLDSNLSLKLTQLGLKLNKEQCFQNVREIVEKARQLNNFVRIDMEDSTCTTDTLDIYKKLRKEYDNVGTVVQAYLKRSQEDVKDLIDNGIAHVRICKGIYDESSDIAYKDKERIRENFLNLIQTMLDSGSHVGIATHDKVVVEKSHQLICSKNIPKSKYEFQMLLGVTENLRSELVAQGQRMRVYVPYGEQWYGYCMRRMKENPQLVGHIVKNLFIHG